MRVILYQNKNYEVAPTSAALQEDGTTYGTGYEIVNKKTRQAEFTHLQLPHCIWTADVLSKSLDELLPDDVQALESKTVN